MITLANLKTYLKITDSTQDSQLNLAISNAVGFLTAYLGYSLELNALKKDEFVGYNSCFELKFAHINSVSLIRYADDRFNPTWVNYATATDIKTHLERGLVETRDILGPFVEITYSFGYDSTTCPKDLASILYDVAAMNFKSMGEISMGDLKSESVDGDSLVFKDITGSLSENSKALLDKYKLYAFSA